MVDADPTYEWQMQKLYGMFCAEWEALVEKNPGVGDDPVGRTYGAVYETLRTDFKEKYLRCPPEKRREYLERFDRLMGEVKVFSGRMQAEKTGSQAEGATPEDARRVETEGDLQQETANPLLPMLLPAGNAVTIPPKPIHPSAPKNAVPAEPTLYFRCQTPVPGQENSRLANLLKKLIDDAPPILGDAGKPFAYRLDLNVDKSHRVSAVRASESFHALTGLQAELENGVIILHGTPPAGYDGKLWFVLEETPAASGCWPHAKPLYLAADPKTLWQNLPFADDQGYPKADEETAGKPVPGTDKSVVAASCRGRSHAHAGKAREDHFAVRLGTESGWNFVAVADGAGSAKFSRKGSELACETVLTVLADLLGQEAMRDSLAQLESSLAEWRQARDKAGGEPAVQGVMPFDAIFHNAVYSAYMAIHNEASTRGAAPRDYHTTLLVAAFRKFAGGYFFVTYWVGDGGMALSGNQGAESGGEAATVVLGLPDGGEFAGQTRFLTMKEEIAVGAIQKRLRYVFMEDFTFLILATDGITDAYFPSESAVADGELWGKFWREILPRGDGENAGCPELFDPSLDLDARAQALRRWLDFWSKGNHDDRTLLLVY